MSIDTLQEKIRALKNPSMVGLDPTPEVVPGYLLEEARQELGATPEAAAAAYRRFCRELMDGLQGLVPAVKVQSACFHALGSAGVAAMQAVLRDARDRGYYVLLDLMRGDVTGTAQLCAASVFGTVEAAGPGYRPYPCDAVTLHGYLGSDSVKPFLPYCREEEKNLFLVVKTSNRSSVEVQDLQALDNRGLPAVRGVSLTVRRGEILGIAGIEGNGQSELIEAITGMRPLRGGTVTIMGKSIAGKTPGEIRALGLAHVPEDRLATGVCAPADITDNLIVGKEKDPRFSWKRIHMKRKAIRAYAQEIFQRFDIRGAGVDTAVGSLSGGNMQKVVVAREFSFDTPVLIISQPTRGVDIGAMDFIHQQIMQKRNAGCAILLVSADLDELLRLSDRLLTIYEGRITGEFQAGDIDKREISYYMTGGRKEEQA